MTSHCTVWIFCHMHILLFSLKILLEIICVYHISDYCFCLLAFLLPLLARDPESLASGPGEANQSTIPYGQWLVDGRAQDQGQ